MIKHRPEWISMDEWQAMTQELEAGMTIQRLRAEIDSLKHHHAEFVLAANIRMADQNAEIEQLRTALGELLSGHDNLYIAHFGPGSNPHDDIAAKPARAALEPKP